MSGIHLLITPQHRSRLGRLLFVYVFPFVGFTSLFRHPLIFSQNDPLNNSLNFIAPAGIQSYHMVNLQTSGRPVMLSHIIDEEDIFMMPSEHHLNSTDSAIPHSLAVTFYS